MNYYIIEYFLEQNKSYLGAVVIAIGAFLVIFGVKFIKVTVFVSGVISCMTICVLIYFNIFINNSTTTVWIVLSVGLILGLILSWFLVKITNVFFMILGGYLGYTLGIFLYNLFLNFIHADPKVIFWVTIIGSIVLGAVLSLWLVKHILIISTSVCGAYAVIRGTSLYLGHFPNESVILDLIQHQEWEQFPQVFF